MTDHQYRFTIDNEYTEPGLWDATVERWQHGSGYLGHDGLASVGWDEAAYWLHDRMRELLEDPA